MAGLNDPGWDNLFDSAAKKYDIDPRLLKAIMYAETGGDSNPSKRVVDTSPAGAVGPMQLLPSSFPGIDWYDPVHAIPAAAKYLAEGRDKLGDDPLKMVMYYHGGPNQQNWGNITRNVYPKMVSDYYRQLNPQTAVQAGGNTMDLNEFFGGNLPKSLQNVSPVPEVGSTKLPTGAVQTDYSPGEAEALTIGKTAIPTSIGKLYDSLSKAFESSGGWEQNLRNAAEVFSKIQAGVTVPIQSEFGRYATSIGIDPSWFGSAKPGLVQEAKKAASAALYASVSGNPALVADMYERQNLKPDVTLEPDAAKSIIANGLAGINMRNDWLSHMNAYAHPNGPGKGSLTGYDQTTFKQDWPNRIKKAYTTLPGFVGEGTEPPVIGEARPIPGGVTIAPDQPKFGKDKNGNYYQVNPDGSLTDLKTGKPYGQ